jgi:hypothetical protein
MEKEQRREWGSVKVDAVLLEGVRKYSELTGAPMSKIVGMALEKWTATEMPALMKLFEKKK